MKLGIFAKTFPGTDPVEALSAAAAAGYDGVQYNLACSGLPSMSEDIPNGTAQAVAAAAKIHGQEIFALSATWNMAHPDPAVRNKGLRQLAAMAPLARAMGTTLLTLCSGSRDVEDQWRYHPGNMSTEAWADMRTSVAAAVEVADRHGVFLGIEPEAANVVATARQAKQLIGELASDRIRIVLDPANLFEVATPEEQRCLVEEAVGLLGERIAMAHAKDRDATGKFATAGKGMVDFDHFLAVLHSAGFQGPVVTHGLAAAEAAGIAQFLRQKLVAI